MPAESAIGDLVPLLPNMQQTLDEIKKQGRLRQAIAAIVLLGSATLAVTNGPTVAIVFAVLAVMLTYAAFSNAVVLDTGSEEIVKQIFEYQAVITTAAIVLAILEIVFYKKPHLKDRHK